jgi:hypothetical protein
VTKRKPTKTAPADSLRDRYARAQAEHERQQATSKKGVNEHAATAQEQAYAKAWSSYQATSKRFSSPQGIIAAIIAGIALHRAEKAYLRDRRIADIDKMTTAARAAAPGKPFPSAAEWIEQQAQAGDPAAAKALKSRDEKRDGEIAAIAERDPQAAALARLEDAAAAADRVLAGRPRRQTDTAEINERLVGDARVQAAEAQERAQASRAAAQQQWAEKGSVLTGIFGGKAYQEHRVLDALAKREEQEAKALTALLPGRLEDCRIAADKIARESVAAARKWEADPAVQAAREERERMAEVRAAVLAGDQATTDAVLQKNPAGATAAAARFRHTPAAGAPADRDPVTDIIRGYR